MTVSIEWITSLKAEELAARPLAFHRARGARAGPQETARPGWPRRLLPSLPPCRLCTSGAPRHSHLPAMSVDAPRVREQRAQFTITTEWKSIAREPPQESASHATVFHKQPLNRTMWLFQLYN